VEPLSSEAAPLDKLALKLEAEYPYGHEAFGLLAIIKVVLWVLKATNVLKIK
jgi:hypothetical protein